MSSNTMINLRPQNVIRQLPWRLDSKAALGFLLILATFSLVGWLYLSQASAVTTTSYRIDELRQDLDHLKNQNFWHGPTSTEPKKSKKLNFQKFIFVTF